NRWSPFFSCRGAAFAAADEGAAAFVLGLDLAEAGMAPNVGPDAGLINRPKCSVTENPVFLHLSPLRMASAMQAPSALTGYGLSSSLWISHARCHDRHRLCRPCFRRLLR